MSNVSAEHVLTCKGDPYSGVTISSEESLKADFGSKIPTAEEAREKLRRSLEHWKATGINGVWFRVATEHSFWIPVLTAEGFDFHNAVPGEATLTKWLPADRPSTLPRYPFTAVGVGGVVENAKGEILMMKERRGHYLGWKFPGGLSDPGESIAEGNHLKMGAYKNSGDLYFVCYLKPKDEQQIEVKPCPQEAAAAQWMSRFVGILSSSHCACLPGEEIGALPPGQIHHFHHTILDRLDALKSSGRRGCHLVTFDPQRKGWAPWDLYNYD
ncbi:Nudix hydrolase 8 [Aphelenchoides fujianensis]|nr:Nudix hydrolase 8 [Aphelenchoides fujianensis]